MNPDVTQGEIDKFVIRQELAKRDHLSVYRGICDGKILDVHKISRAFEAEKSNVACRVIHPRIRNQQGLDLH